MLKEIKKIFEFSQNKGIDLSDFSLNEDAYAKVNGNSIIFLSFGREEERALVIKGTGSSIKDAIVNGINQYRRSGLEPNQNWYYW